MAKFSYDSKKRKAIIQIDDLDLVREHFSYPNEGAVFARRRGNWYVPQRSYIITPTGRYDVGMTFDIIKFLKRELPSEPIELDNSITHLIKPQIKADKVSLALELRDYQDEIVDECVKFGRGVVVLATAGGKTLTMANLLERIYQSTPKKDTWKALIIVPDLGLVNQTFSDFENYKVSFTHGKWTGNNPVNIADNVIIANMGILQSDKSDIDFINYVDVLIIDEVHKIRAKNKINKIVSKINTPNKFGFTGTLPDNDADTWNIFGKMGPTIYEKGSYELRLENYVSNALVQVVKLNYKTKPQYSTEINDPGERYRQEFEFLFTNSFRNKIIKKLSTGVKKNTLILVDFIRHGEELYNVLSQDKTKKVYFIQGDVDVEERDKIKKLIESNDNIICIAISKIFSTGISINNLHYIIFASGGKAKVKILQSIGRGLRLHKNKNKLVIIDIADQLRYSAQHSERRIELYQKENIQTKVVDFYENS
jgi:superfamily II DNA or RNA helicase